MMKLSGLTVEQIKRITRRYRSANKLAVENFLVTIDGLTPYEAYQNLAYDSFMYHWNKGTVNAILFGIRIAMMNALDPGFDVVLKEQV